MGGELKLGIVGAGRIGVFHARHVQEIAAGSIDAAVVSSRTEDHEAHTRTPIDAGCRVLLEKPLAPRVA